MEERKHLGFEVMAFMLLLTGMLFLTYRRIWRDAH
jgi:ubiquinol-cytochrome c reductase cytochrome b/c1 subunit